MKSEEIIRKLILDFQQSPLPAITDRSLNLTFIKNMSLSIAGARRCGKTYRTLQFVRDFCRTGNIEDVCRIQFNDHRLISLSAKSLSIIDETYYNLYPEKRNREDVYFIFDEIHRIEGWEDYVLSLLENEKHKVLLTGSTSKLLKGEISSALRGKNFPRDLYPFSFAEFLSHHGIKTDTRTSTGQSFVKKYFDIYLGQGGFPGLLDLEASLHVSLLQTYWDTMLLKDVIEAHPGDNINIQLFTYFAQSLVSRTSCPFTIRKMMAEMQALGMNFGTGTLYKYLQYLEEAFILFSVPIYTQSAKVKSRNYQKIYAIDWALAAAVAPGEAISPSKRLENLVYVELLRRGYRVYYYKTQSGFEIDFVLLKKSKPSSKPEIVQVCYHLQDAETMEREVRGIPEAVKFLNAQKALIITRDETRTIQRKGVKIQIVPAWKWLVQS